MAYATLQQLEARVPGGIPSDDEARATALLLDVSAVIADLVDTETAAAWETETPDVVVAVACAAAYRAIVNPLGHASVTEGNYTWRADKAEAVWLTDDEEKRIRRAAGLNQFGTIEKETEYGFEGGVIDQLLGF
jgi:hypothetical protein